MALLHHLQTNQNMQNPITCSIAIAEHILPVIQNSGRYLFRLGHYESCLETPNFKYNYLTFGMNGSSIGASLGTCLPSVCSHSDINQTFKLIFKEIHLPFFVFDIDSESENYDYGYNWAFYVTFLIISISIILVVLGTFSNLQSKIVRAFNVKKSMGLFKMDERSDLNIFNGVRALAMMWVVFSHAYSFALGGAVNSLTLDHVTVSPFFLIIEAGLVAVDVFFFLGGFFLAFVFLREKSKSNLKYLLAIINRVFRIWPAYLVCMLFYYSMFEHLGSGPLWGKGDAQVKVCSGLYRSLFFFDNFYHDGAQICLGWGWYLQVDFQLFMMCLAVLFVYSKNKKGAYCLIIALSLYSTYFNIAWTQKYGQKLFTQMSSFLTFIDYFSDVYIMPYGRCVPYFMGLVFGIFYTENYFVDKKKLIKNSQAHENLEPLEKENIVDVDNWPQKIKRILITKRLVRVIVEWLGIAIMAVLTFIPRGLQEGELWDQIWHSLYLFFSKPLFILGIILVVFPTMVGARGSFLATVLDTKLFNFIAKISFCTYLVHLMIIHAQYESIKFDTYYTIENVTIVYLGMLVLSLFFGFVLALLIQIPFAHLQREAMTKLMHSFKKDKLKQISSPLIESGGDVRINETIVKATVIEGEGEISKEKEKQSNDQ